MPSHLTRSIPLNIAIVIIGGGALIYFGIDASADARFGIVGIVGAISAAIVNQRYINQREFTARHFASKLQGYQEFADMFFDLAASEKGGPRPSDEDLRERYVKMKKKALFSSGPTMVKAWNNYELLLAEAANKDPADNDPIEAVYALDDIIREIRRDLGHDDSSLSRGDIVRSLILKKDEQI